MASGSGLVLAADQAPLLHAVTLHADVGGGLPDGLYDILLLAGVIIFSITTLSAVLSSIFVKKDNLFYLGTQLVLLSVFLLLSAHWIYKLWMSDIFHEVDELSRLIQTLLFLSLAYTLDMFMKLMVWARTVGPYGRRSVPPLLVGSVRVLIYLFAALFVIQFVYDKSITALAALSGAFALVVGLSAQTTLGEMFAGIAIALSRPFQIGDWVQVGNLEEGKVLDMTWRMVRIETRDRIVLNVPNRTIADQSIRNFTYPNRAVRITDAIYFSQDDDPRLIQELLREAMVLAPETLADPAPYVLYRGAKNGVAEYSLRYYIDDYQLKDIATENVWKCVVERVASSATNITFPRRYIELSADSAAIVKA